MKQPMCCPARASGAGDLCSKVPEVPAIGQGQDSSPLNVAAGAPIVAQSTQEWGPKEATDTCCRLGQFPGDLGSSAVEVGC